MIYFFRIIEKIEFPIEPNNSRSCYEGNKTRDNKRKKCVHKDATNTFANARYKTNKARIDPDQTIRFVCVSIEVIIVMLMYATILTKAILIGKIQINSF